MQAPTKNLEIAHQVGRPNGGCFLEGFVDVGRIAQLELGTRVLEVLDDKRGPVPRVVSFVLDRVVGAAEGNLAHLTPNTVSANVEYTD